MARLPLSCRLYPRKIHTNGSWLLNVSSIHKRDISRRLIPPSPGFERRDTGTSARVPSLPNPLGVYFYRGEVPAAWFSGTTCCSPAQRIPRKASVATCTHGVFSSSHRALSPCFRHVCTLHAKYILPLLSTASSKAPFVRGPRNLELSPNEDDARACVRVLRMPTYVVHT